MNIIIFFLIWILLSGLMDRFYLISGMGAAFISAIIYRNLTKHESFRVVFSAGIMSYCLWLFIEIIKSSWDVTKKIWSYNLEISPSIKLIQTKLHSPGKKILYAGSITLTPGTISIDLDHNSILVHALQSSSHQELMSGRMERRIRKV